MSVKVGHPLKEALRHKKYTMKKFLSSVLTLVLMGFFLYGCIMHIGDFIAILPFLFGGWVFYNIIDNYK